MQAIDAAICPEVNQKQFIFEMSFISEWITYIKPVMVTWKFFYLQFFDSFRLDVLVSVCKISINKINITFSIHCLSILAEVPHVGLQSGR